MDLLQTTTGAAARRERLDDPRGIEIVGFDEELLDGAAALRAVEWGGSQEAQRDYLEWKYVRNPYLRDPLVHFATLAGEVIGMRGSMGTCWELSGRRHVVPHGGDLIVVPRFRRRGVSRLLLAAATEEYEARGFDWTVSFSANPLGVRSASASGWREVAGFTTIECGGTRASAARRRVTARCRLLLEQRRGGAMLRRIGRRTSAHRRADPLARVDREHGGEIFVSRRADPRWLAVIPATPPDRRLRHVRDAEYFDWRLSNPLSDVRVLWSPTAYAILERRRSSTTVSLVDWRFGDPDAFAAVLRVALCAVGVVRLWLPADDDVATSVIRSAGHVEPVLDAPGTFVIRLLSGVDEPRLDGLRVDDRTNWDLRLLDSDLS